MSEEPPRPQRSRWQRRGQRPRGGGGARGGEAAPVEGEYPEADHGSGLGLGRAPRRLLALEAPGAAGRGAGPSLRAHRHLVRAHLLPQRTRAPAAASPATASEERLMGHSR